MLPLHGACFLCTFYIHHSTSTFKIQPKAGYVLDDCYGRMNLFPSKPWISFAENDTTCLSSCLRRDDEKHHPKQPADCSQGFAWSETLALPCLDCLFLSIFPFLHYSLFKILHSKFNPRQGYVPDDCCGKMKLFPSKPWIPAFAGMMKSVIAMTCFYSRLRSIAIPLKAIRTYH